MSAATPPKPGLIGRFRSRQSGHPSGLVGRIFGRAMVKDTADANDRAIELLGLSAPSTVLEVGFGQGRSVAVLVAAGHRVLGVDPSLTMVNQAAARNRAARRAGSATLLHSDGITIPFRSESADAAFTVHTVYFMPNPSATFAEIARVLRPGGTVVVACRTSDTPIPAWMDPGVYRIPTAAQVTAMLTSVGFEDVIDHTQPRPNEPAGADGALVARSSTHEQLRLFSARLPDAGHRPNLPHSEVPTPRR